MTCYSCGRAKAKSRTVATVRLPSGASVPLCSDCATDDFRIAHAQRKLTEKNGDGE